MNLSSIQTAEPFVSLFPIDAATLARVTEHMQANGYDAAHPLIVWSREEDSFVGVTTRFILIDGHTRLAAATACGLSEAPVIVKEFASEDEAVEYAIHCQRDRRNITDADLLRWEAETKRRREGRPSNTPQSCGVSAKERAESLGVSTRKVEQVRTVMDHAAPEVKAAVLSGEKSINRAYTETQQQRRKCEKCGAQLARGEDKICGLCRGTRKLLNTEPPKRLTVEPNMPVAGPEHSGRTDAPRPRTQAPREESANIPLDQWDPEFRTAFDAMIVAIKHVKQKKWATIPKKTAAQACEQLLAIIQL